MSEEFKDIEFNGQVFEHVGSGENALEKFLVTNILGNFLEDIEVKENENLYEQEILLQLNNLLFVFEGGSASGLGYVEVSVFQLKEK